jgi:sortase A
VSVEAPPQVVTAETPEPPQPPATVARERPPMPGPAMVAFASVAALSAMAIFLVVFALGFSALQEQRSQHQLYASFRGLLAPASPVAPQIGGVITPGAPVALINSEAAGLHNMVVVEGTSSTDLLKGPGHLRDSPLPGQVGQSLVLGKSVTAGGPFRRITQLAKGDTITVQTGQGTFRFTVIDRRVGGDPLPPVPTGGALLTLVTSTGSGFAGHFAPSHVVYVDATLVGKAVSAPVGRPVAVPVAELPGRSDPGAWPFLILWLQGLILAGVGSVWAWLRWGRWQTWLVGAPIILGVLWGISEEAMSLLPNLL